LVSDSAKVRVATLLGSEEPITSIEWDDGTDTWAAVPLDPANPLKTTMTRDIVLPLQKESRTLRVRAKSAKSESATGLIEIAYHPPLPEAKITDLPVNSSGSVTNREVLIVGTVSGNTAEVPFQIALRVVAADGTSKSFDTTVDRKLGTWKVVVNLSPGVNKIDLIVRNAWREEIQPNLAQITYRRPPKLFGVQPADAGNQAVADIVATVETAEGMDPTFLVVNGRPVDTNSPKKVLAQAGVVKWEVTAPAVPVKIGTEWQESLRVSVRNADGDSETVMVPVKRKIIQLQPPVVAIEDGLKHRIVEMPDAIVGFKVTSQTPLTRVVVEQASGAAGRFERVADVDLTTAVVKADGVILTTSVRLELREGVNRFRISAVNAGGETLPEEFSLSRTTPAVQVIIEGVEELAPNQAAARLLTRKESSGSVAFDGALTGFVRVRGRVRWSSDTNPIQRDPILTAVLFANQVGHLPVTLEPATSPGGDRTFSAPVFLNAPTTNVRVELRTGPRGKTVPQQARGGDIQIRCQNPLTKQRLHVVVVGVDVPSKDRFALIQQVVESLGGIVPPEKVGRFDRGEFKAGSFAQAFLYRPEIGEVVKGRVANVLEKVGREVTRLSTGAKNGWVNDVILLYYQGEDWIGTDGRRRLQTSQSKQYPKETEIASDLAIPVDELPTTPGVRLLLLNVVSPRLDQPAPDTVALGPPLLRYVWKDGDAAGRLLPLFTKAVTDHPTLGQIVDSVRNLVTSDPKSAGQPFEVLPADLRPRLLGVGRP